MAISLRIMVDKDKNRVLFAVAGKYFVDIILNFLTMPLVTIARLVNKDSNLKRFRLGSITSLYRSVQDLDTKYFCTDTCKHMLLHPRNPMEFHCRNPKIDIDDTEPMYIVCSWGCRNTNVLVAMFRNQSCKCGSIFSQQIECDGTITERHKSVGYVDEEATFVIFDNLTLKSCDEFTYLGFLRNHCSNGGQLLEVFFTQSEVLDLLKCSLFSNSPLTDFLLRKKRNISVPYEFCCCLNIKEESISEDNKKVKVKLMVIKSKKKVLFAEIEKDFMDLLLSFLTFPLAAVEHVFHGNSNFVCMDKLYRSVVELNVKNFKCEELKNMLINPGVAPYFNVKNQVLPIQEVKHSDFGCIETTISNLKTMKLTVARESSKVSTNAFFRYVPVTILDPKEPSIEGKASSRGGFIKGGSKFIVTDQLYVKPYSFISVVSFLNDYKEQESDLEEIVIYIGVREVMSLLKASITSSSALSVGLGPFIKYFKEEKTCNLI